LPQIAAIGAIIVELGGGTMLVLGWKTHWAAVVLFVFTAVAGLIFHNFWAAPAKEVSNQMTHFLKNLCIMGGLLYVLVHGSGPFSIEGRLSDSSGPASPEKAQSRYCALIRLRP
jgi:putative oxidoreductase